MTIKYSPELERGPDESRGNRSWVERGPALPRAWCCARSIERHWGVHGSRSCWIAVTDEPVSGAMELQIRPSQRSSPDLEIRRAGTRPWRIAFYPLEDLILSFYTDRVWLWIEIPNE